MTTLLLAQWKLVVIMLLAMALATVTQFYWDKCDELTAFEAKVEQAGIDAQADKARVEQAHADTLAQIRKDHEAAIPEIRAGAVANYRAAHRLPKPAAPGGPLPRDSSGISLDDDSQRQCLPDETLIENAAEDAEKLAAWIAYCTRNTCPVKD